MAKRKYTRSSPSDTIAERKVYVLARRDYKNASISALPFVYWPKRGFKNVSNWCVPPVNDYGVANEIGREYAAHFAQYLKDKPVSVGSNVLGHIVAAIDFKDESDAKGYWVGFFSHLERLIYAQAQRMDVFADVDRINAYYVEMAAKRALEAETEGE